MNRTDVKVLMIQKGVTVSRMARAIEVTPQAVYDVMASHRSSKRIEATLEAELGLPIADIRAGWGNEDSPSTTIHPRMKNLRAQLDAAAGQ